MLRPAFVRPPCPSVMASHSITTNWAVCVLDGNLSLVEAKGDVHLSLSLNADINFIEQGATAYTTLIGHQGAVNGCYFSSNTGSVLTYGGDGRVLEWIEGKARVIAVGSRGEFHP